MPFSSASLPSPKKSLRSENFPQKFPSIINMVNGLRFVLMRCVSFGYQDLIELGTMRPKERKKERQIRFSFINISGAKAACIFFHCYIFARVVQNKCWEGWYFKANLILVSTLLHKFQDFWICNSGKNRRRQERLKMN
jgi:hypothetical protein